MGEADAVTAIQDSDVARRLSMYRTMRLIREFEDKVQLLFAQGAVHGTTHLYQGQEAVATGVCSALTGNDMVSSTYRGHGHALARGVDPQLLLDELLGRSTGIAGGRSGSMNVIDRAHGLIGCFGIVGGSIAAATGAALATRRTGGVSAAFFGEGAINQAYFSECLNFAKVFSLPIVFVCENNLYGEFTPWKLVTAGSITGRVAALEIPTKTIDGNNVWEVYSEASGARHRAADGGGPQFIEALTYRFAGHSRTDPGAYRKPGELEEWQKRDPLGTCRSGLSRDGVDGGRLDDIDAEVKNQVEVMAANALSAPFPSADEPIDEYKDSE